MPFLLQPPHRVLAARDQQLAEIGIGAIFGHPAHVVEELVPGVGAEIRVGDFILGEIGHQRLEIIDAVIDAAERPGGEPAVAAGLRFRCALEHEHGDAMLGRRERRAERGIAGADHDDIG